MSLQHGWSTVILVVAAVLCAPDKPDTYLRLLAGYRAYDEAAARELGDFWEQLEAHGPGATDSLARRLPIELGPISQMALTDLALAAFANGKKGVANTHLSLAQRWIDVNLTRTSNDPIQQRQLRFARDWYHAIIWLRFAHAEGELADKILAEARLKFPDDPDVLLSSGTFEELELMRMRATFRPATSRSVPSGLSGSELVGTTGVLTPYRIRQVRAIEYLNKAIALDPNAADARIRLGYLFSFISGASMRWSPITARRSPASPATISSCATTGCGSRCR